VRTGTVINLLARAADGIIIFVQVSPNKHQAHYYLGSALLLLAKNEVTLSPPFLSLVHKAKDEFFAASQYLHGVKGIVATNYSVFIYFYAAYNFSFIRACALLGQEQELGQLLPSFVSTFPENAVAWLSEPDFDHYRSYHCFLIIFLHIYLDLRRHKWFQVLTARISSPNSNPYPFQPLPPQPTPAQPLPPPHSQPTHPSHSLSPSPPQQQPIQKPQQSPEKQNPLPAYLNPTHPLHNIADYELLNSYPPPQQPHPDIPYFVYPDPYAYQPMSTIPPPAQVAPQRQAPIKAGMEEKQYGQLQSSLIESGFSIKRLLEVFSWLPVSSGILQVFLIFYI
jgi:hypothetical protein